jgi:N-acetylglucosamine malate deacetylase 1
MSLWLYINMKTLLVVSPHPDDLEIGMGGSVAQAVDQGGRVISVVLTDGRRSPRSFECSDDEMAEIRKREAEAAGMVLGLESIFFLGLSDLRSDDNRQSARAQLVELLERYNPGELYVPHPELDRHESHRLGSRLCLDALEQLTATVPGPAVWAYEVWGLFPRWDRVEDISGVVERKAAAINCHSSQVADVAYTEGVLGLNRWRAVFTDPHNIPSHRYVEAFIRL